MSKCFTKKNSSVVMEVSWVAFCKGKYAFTLAEVLITLGIIGVVAAMTIPGLVSNIQSKVTENQRKVANARLVEGLNMLNIKENGLSVHYNNTEEFVRALSKHMKLVQICGSGELNKCFPYENINYESSGEVKQAKVSSLKTQSRLKLTGDGWLEPAGFITANGIPYIISFNNNCSGATDANGATIIDPERPLPCKKDTGCQIPYQCIDGIYDLNGSRTPNKFDKDIETIHSARLDYCIKEFDDLCLVTKGFDLTSAPKISYNDCETKYKGKIVNACFYHSPSDTKRDNDFWLGAKIQCMQSGGHLANDEDLAKLASYMYTDSSGKHPNISASGATNIDTAKYTLNTELLKELNIYNEANYIDYESIIVSGTEISNFVVNYRTMNPDETNNNTNYSRFFQAFKSICIGD